MAVVRRIRAAGRAGEVRATSLRARLLLGLGVAVAVPFVVFALLARDEVGRRTGRVGLHLLDVLARDTGNRLGARLAEARRLAELLAIDAVVRARLAGSGGEAEWSRWLARSSVQLGAFDGVLLVSSQSKVVLQWQRGQEVQEARGSPARAAFANLLAAAAGRDEPGFLEPQPDPLGEGTAVATSRDPERYALPLVVPLRDDTQAALGSAFFFLPMSRLQDELDRTRDYLYHEVEVEHGDVYVLAAASRRHVLHTDRARLGSLAGEGETGGAVATTAVAMVPQLGWTIGVRADRAELLARSTGNLVGFFLVLVLLVLGAALGIATLISLAATRSLRALEQVTERLGQGDLGQRAEVRGPRETRKLALALNTMADKLDAGRERLKAAERDRAWTAMARQVAHEIKNPLQPVRLHAELIQRAFGQIEIDAALRERGRASAGVILRQVDALQRIVSDFSAFAQAGQPVRDGQRFAASEVVRDVEALYAAGAERGVRVEFVAEGGDAELRGSALRLQQVLVNLVKNAVEASPDGGVVEVGHGALGECWRVEVRDRGPGLPPELLEHAFEPSFSTKPGGTGLGLAISQRNVDAMGGRIALRPREGSGLVARVELERAPPA